MLANEQIADDLLSDMDAYGDIIREIIIGRLMDSTNFKVYWDAWFRGAEGKDLEDAERGIIYKPKKNKKNKVFDANEILNFLATDPDTHHTIEMTLFKHNQANALFAIDSSYLEQCFDDDEDIIINDPFNKDRKVKLNV
jgi:hypothetical protein